MILQSTRRIAITTCILASLAGLLSASQEARAEKVEVKVSMPALSFTIKTDDVSGNAVLTKDGKVVAENIKVKLDKIETGMSLRNKHTKDYLGADKNPEVILVKAEGKDGKGKGILKVNGIDKPIEGTFTVQGDQLKAEFPVLMSDYGIKAKYMGVGPKDKVEVSVTVPLKKQ